MSIVEQQKEQAYAKCMLIRNGKPCPMVSMGQSVDSCSCGIGETPDSCVEYAKANEPFTFAELEAL